MTGGGGKPLIGSLGDLALMAGMPSEPTLRRLIAENDDFPIVSRGTNGRAYEIDLATAHKFVRGLAEREAEEQRRHREMVGQLSLQLLGDDALGSDAQIKALSPTEQAQAMNAEFLRMKIAEKRGELVRAADVEAGLAEDMVLLHDESRAFSSDLSKRGEFSREQLALIDQLMEEWMTKVANRMEGLKESVALSDDSALSAALSKI